MIILKLDPQCRPSIDRWLCGDALEAAAVLEQLEHGHDCVVN
jgi:hypothetical protein